VHRLHRGHLLPNDGSLDRVHVPRLPRRDLPLAAWVVQVHAAAFFELVVVQLLKSVVDALSLSLSLQLTDDT
jgi:hypothetical protein